jgi:hypothetical protein
MAYFAQLQQASATDVPIDVGAWYNQPAYSSGGADARAKVSTLGFGMQPTENLGVFAYTNETKITLDGHNSVYGFMSNTFTSTTFENTVRHSALGLSYRWSPVSQTWVKLGASNDESLISAYPVVFGSESMFGIISVFAKPTKKFNDLQIRHTVDISAATRLSLDMEAVKESQYNERIGSGPVVINRSGFGVGEYLILGGTNDIDRRTTSITFAVQHRPIPSLLLDGALAGTHLDETTLGEDETLALYAARTTHNLVPSDANTNRFAPRLGVAFKPAEQLTVRAAYQDWIRPLSVSTLNSVETAGIPLEDRLVEAGGRVKRSVAQLAWTHADNLFITVKADRQEISNLTSQGVDLRTPSLPFLEALRNTQTVNLTSVDVLEATPNFEVGTVSAFSVGVNRLLTPNLSGYLKYTRQETTSEYESTDNPSGRMTGKVIPYMPRDTGVFGVTWNPGYRTYLGVRAVYRSDRYEEKENLTLWPANWSLDVIGFWETMDKHWVIGLGALNLGGSKTPRQTERYVLDARYRF